MAEDAGQTVTELKVDGGACRNDFLMQFQADIINCVATESLRRLQKWSLPAHTPPRHSSWRQPL